MSAIKMRNFSTLLGETAKYTSLKNLHIMNFALSYVTQCSSRCPLSHNLHRSCTTCSPLIPGDHLSGKPGNVREFDSCQKCQGKNLIREKLPKNCLL